jgi:hypothetical protein
MVTHIAETQVSAISGISVAPGLMLRYLRGWEARRAVPRVKAQEVAWEKPVDLYNTHRIHGAGIYANIWGILMGSMLPHIAYMDPMGYVDFDGFWLADLEGACPIPHSPTIS